MRFLSVCSGIEAASVAWQPLGWKAAAFSEIEPFPCAVLAHHYPDTPNLGDMTKFKEWPDDLSVDLLCGGTPCQSFSVAGLRKGLDDPRGNLMLTYGALAAKYRPRWLVWENVPGVLSSNEGRDFGSFLWLLGELGYGYAYRVLDAQYFGVPQRRRRVFVVGCLGDWRAAAAVLFERHSLSGHPAPRREAGKGVTGTLSARTEGGGGLGTDFELGGGLIPDVGRALTTSNQRIDAETETFIVEHILRGEGFDASEDGTGSGTPLVPVVAGALCRDSFAGGAGGRPEGASAGHFLPVASAMKVRRLTPRECERLQGFPVDYTLLPFGARKKIEAEMLLYLRMTQPELTMEQARQLAADGPRYKALGNSWAVPCARWIGQRIAAVEAVTEPLRRAA
ncbi:DNA cytosine methyltransferase [Variovorax sp. RB3P1]|uniref:DNA cytosine methyltransferase n=1 Tax=Variovorax sp. RB3P1 TaxID=3443732 RepID=UPI003F45D255